MTNAAASPAEKPMLYKIADWALRLLIATAFAAAAAAKLAGAPPMVDIFAKLGFGQWFRYVTALVELSGALLIAIPASALLGALLLGATMVCAVAAHLTRIGGSPVPALILLALVTTVFLMRRK